MGVGCKGKQEAGLTERANRRRASQGAADAHPATGEKSAKSELVQLVLVGTARARNETGAASKPVPEDNVRHQQSVSAAPGCC